MRSRISKHVYSPALSLRAAFEATKTPAPHPRSLGWPGTVALAMGGSNQSLFLIGALIASQGSAAIPLLAFGLLLSIAAAPGWTELILMWPNRVGGIAATCAEAFRPYSPVLGNLTGVCYWWGWVPTCGLTAILSATAIKEWYLPGLPVKVLAVGLVLFFTVVNICGIRWVSRIALPVACVSGALAFLSGLVPLLTGNVRWHQATTFHLSTPFTGPFGHLTSAMAGLYLVGFAAPAFEAAACHVGETVDPARNVPRAMFASAVMATLYFVVLPVIWLGALGTGPLAGNLQETLGPTFAPVLGDAARSAAIVFMMFNMFHGTLQPLAGAARTLMQIAEDGLLPRIFALRSRTDAPWVATVVTAGMAILFLLTGDPTWVIAAANLAYLIGIALPNVAVWLLRRNAPEMERLYRAPRGTIVLGLVAAGVWGVSVVLGFEQFGLQTVLIGIVLCYSGAVLYAIRRWTDGRAEGVPRRNLLRSLHLKLTVAMLMVLVLDAVGYYIAVSSLGEHNTARGTALEDIFVTVAVLTISVGLILPGMVAHSAGEVARAATRLADGTLADLRRALQALSRGDLDDAHARVDLLPVTVRTRDELGAMAASFNTMQDEVARAAFALDGAREGLRQARSQTDLALHTVEANERRLAMQYAAVRILAETTDLSFAMPRLIETVCQSFEWTLGAFWTTVGDTLRCQYSWYPDDMTGSPFIGHTHALELPYGEGLPGAAWHAGTPRWIVDVQDDLSFPRHAEAVALGLHTAFCFPIKRGDRFHGVLEFFTGDVRNSNPTVIDAVTALGAVIGSAIERETMQEALRASEESYRSLVETSPDAILALEPSGEIRTANPSAALLFGCASAEHMLGKPALDLFAPEDREKARISLQHGAGSRLRLGRATEYALLRNTGTVFRGEVSSNPILVEDGTVDGVMVVVRDITDRKHFEEELKHQALHDALTRLPNRTLLYDRLEQAILSARHSGGSLALLLMDLNRFKEVNDTLGHHAGDTLLQEVAARLQGTLRDSDTVARLGGDEFAVILPAVDEQHANTVVNKMHSVLRRPLILEGHRVDIDASVGVALYPAHGTDASALLRRADIAMYAAKRAGEGYRTYAPDQDLNSTLRLALVADLRDTIDRGQLLLHYQPKIEIGTGAVAHVEALVRWQHPEHGLISPGEFIPLAEETGLIEPLTLWVLKTALKQCADWRKAGLELGVAVNLSARNLHDPYIPDTIAWLIRSAAVDASALIVEITESTLMDDPAGALGVLTRLHKMGVKISIDDFGTGYSSLAYLKQLPVDEIKIDRSFVLGMTVSGTVIVRSVIDLGRNLGLQVTAEGVEDEEMLETLASMGCGMAQGFHISRPLPAADLTGWLMARPGSTAKAAGK